MKPVLLDLFTSKKFLAFAATVIVVIGNKICGHFGYELDPSQVQLIVGSGAAYVVGQGIADHGKEAAKVIAAAQPKAAP